SGIRPRPNIARRTSFVHELATYAAQNRTETGGTRFCGKSCSIWRSGSASLAWSRACFTARSYTAESTRRGRSRWQGEKAVSLGLLATFAAGGPERIRTPDPCPLRPTLYPAELPAPDGQPRGEPDFGLD